MLKIKVLVKKVHETVEFGRSVKSKTIEFRFSITRLS